MKFAYLQDSSDTRLLVRPFHLFHLPPFVLRTCVRLSYSALQGGSMHAGHVRCGKQACRAARRRLRTPAGRARKHRAGAC